MIFHITHDHSKTSPPTPAAKERLLTTERIELCPCSAGGTIQERQRGVILGVSTGLGMLRNMRSPFWLTGLFPPETLRGHSGRVCGSSSLVR